MKHPLRNKIIKLTNEGLKPAEIAKATGASLSYVYVVRSAYKKQVPKHILDMLKPHGIVLSNIEIKQSLFTRIKKFFGV